MKISTSKTFVGVMALSTMLGLSFNSVAEVAVPGNYKVDPTHSTVLFTVNHLGFSETIGRFNDFEGDLVLNPKGTSKVDISIKTASVDSNHDKRDTHLRSPDFLNVKQFPTMRFVSKKVSLNSQGEPVKIQGDLTLHGKTNPVTLNVKPVGAGKDPWGGYRTGYNASTVVKRSDYGMNFMQGGIGDDIEITLKIEAIKQ